MKAPLGQTVMDPSLTLDHSVHDCDISIPLKRISEGGYLWSNQVADMITRQGHESVMDIGCQLGQLYHSLSLGNWTGRYQGLDISDFYVDKAHELFHGLDNIRFDLHSVEEPIVPRFSPCSVVVCSAVFEHTLDPQQALCNMMAAASERLILRTMPGSEDLVNTLKISSEYLCRQFCQQKLVASLEQGGFSVKIHKDIATQSESYKVLDDIHGNAVYRRIYILDCQRIS